MHNGMVVQQLYVARLQLHVHAKLIECCHSVELGKGCELSGR